jgi:hypothetical protein
MQTKEVEEEGISSPSLDGLDRLIDFVLPTDDTEGRKVQGSTRDFKGLKCWSRKVNTRLGKSQKSERILLLVEIIITRSEQLQESYHSKADYYFRLNWNGCVFTTQRHTNTTIQILNCHKRNLQGSYILSSSFLHHHPLSCQVKVTMQRPAIVRGYDANSHDSRVSKLQGSSL